MNGSNDTQDEIKSNGSTNSQSLKKMNFLEESLLGVPFSVAYKLLPGLLFVIVVAIFSIWLSNFIGITLMGFTKSPISAVMIGLILGMVINNVFKLPKLLNVGFRFSVKKLLRLGIILLGIRLSIFSVLELGIIGIPIVIICIFSALVITVYLNKRLKQPKRLGTLIAVGTSICGVSAIVATSPVINAKEEETAYAVAVITIFGLTATLIYPIIAYFIFGGDPIKAGLWLGTSIHDTSQVTGAAMVFADLWSLPLGLDVATVTKLVRNVFMVLIIPLMALHYKRSEEKIQNNSLSEKVESPKINFKKLIPIFVIGFLLMSIFRSLGDIGINATFNAFGFISEESWDTLITLIKDFAGNLFVIALCGVGLTTNFNKFKGLGIKPFLVGLIAALSIGILSFTVVSIIGDLLTF